MECRLVYRKNHKSYFQQNLNLSQIRFKSVNVHTLQIILLLLRDICLKEKRSLNFSYM